MRTSNPALNEKAFSSVSTYGYEQPMTVDGTVNKTSILLILVIASAYITWNMFLQTNSFASVSLITMAAGIVGFITGLITIFKKEFSPVTAPIYACAEGLMLGGISAHFESTYPGIVTQAVMLTFGTLGGLLLAYKSRLIRATENFKLGVFAATAGIGIVYLISFVMSFFGKSIPMIHSSGTIGIAFSLFVVVIAALNLVLDFDFIENAAEQGVPKYMEWYASFGLIVTLVWLYLEILRLLAKMNSRK